MLEHKHMEMELKPFQDEGAPLIPIFLTYHFLKGKNCFLKLNYFEF